MGGYDNPDVALPAAPAVILISLDQDLVVSLVATQIPILLYGLLHGLIQFLEQPRRMSGTCLFVRASSSYHCWGYTNSYYLRMLMNVAYT